MPKTFIGEINPCKKAQVNDETKQICQLHNEVLRRLFKKTINKNVSTIGAKTTVPNMSNMDILGLEKATKSSICNKVALWNTIDTINKEPKNADKLAIQTEIAKELFRLGKIKVFINKI
ncbi:hypothetical protein [Thalassotalea sp. PP2-459]|uniref:hypothetical protein n=1 Tax=Thalassotalea sp. PP2-459 TaxID=1742724 RepID=UPI000942FB01|nr:hypothetical protein [Thalassotalea sp. PP2-459]OKY26232.1 hypothetical protein BI291_12955 [Thalassotalea sp. PP2-459]